MTMKTLKLKTYGSSKSSSKREVYSNTILPQETIKTSNRQPKEINESERKKEK